MKEASLPAIQAISSPPDSAIQALTDSSLETCRPPIWDSFSHCRLLLFYPPHHGQRDLKSTRDETLSPLKISAEAHDDGLKAQCNIPPDQPPWCQHCFVPLSTSHAGFHYALPNRDVSVLNICMLGSPYLEHSSLRSCSSHCLSLIFSVKFPHPVASNLLCLPLCL